MSVGLQTPQNTWQNN